MAVRNKTTISRRLALGWGAFGLLTVVALGAISSPSWAATEDEAGEFLSSLTARSIEQLTDMSVSEVERKVRFRELFSQNFDVAAIGRFVLGRYGRGAKGPVLSEFLVTFEDVMVARFAPQFSGYGDTRFKIGTIHQVQNRDQYIVSSSITPPGKTNEINIDWRLRLKNGQFTVLDIVGEGVSMALTLRAEYGSVLKSSGGKIDHLIGMLRERVGDQAAAAN